MYYCCSWPFPKTPRDIFDSFSSSARCTERRQTFDNTLHHTMTGRQRQSTLEGENSRDQPASSRQRGRACTIRSKGQESGACSARVSSDGQIDEDGGEKTTITRNAKFASCQSSSSRVTQNTKNKRSQKWPEHLTAEHPGWG